MGDPLTAAVAVSLKLPLKSPASGSEPLESGIWVETPLLSLPLALLHMAISLTRRQGISATAGGGSNNNSHKGKASPRATKTTRAMGKNQPRKFMKHKSGGKKSKKNQRANLNGDDDDEVAAVILNDRKGGKGFRRQRGGWGKDKSGNGCGHTQDNK